MKDSAICKRKMLVIQCMRDSCHDCPDDGLLCEKHIAEAIKLDKDTKVWLPIFEAQYEARHMRIPDEVREKLLQLLDRIEEDAQVDFLGTGSDRKFADKNESEWRLLFTEAKAIVKNL